MINYENKTNRRKNGKRGTASRYYAPNRRDTPEDFFPMSKAVFRLGLDYGEGAFLACLMY